MKLAMRLPDKSCLTCPFRKGFEPNYSCCGIWEQRETDEKDGFDVEPEDKQRTLFTEEDE